MMANNILTTIVAQGIWDPSSIVRMFSGDSLFLVLVVLGVCVLAAIACVAKWKWFSKPARAIDDPRSLFIELCRAHGVSRTDQRLMEKLAESVQLANDTEIFLRPDVFENGEIAHKLGVPQQAFSELRKKLFS
jgi:hypothetical protein